MSKRFPCGAARRIFKLADEPCAGIVHVEVLSLWRRVHAPMHLHHSAYSTQHPGHSIYTAPASKYLRLALL